MLAPAKYRFMKDLGAPLLMALRERTRRRRPARPDPDFGPPLKSSARLKEIMTRHYYLARFAPGARPVAWVSSGAPVEILRVFDFYTVYPENHGALCGARHLGPRIAGEAEERGYSQDLCSYARIDLGHFFSGQTPVGRLPRPDLLFCSNNICQTVLYWYKALAHYLGVPLLLFDTPYNFTDLTGPDLAYMARQLEDMIPDLERISGRRFSQARFTRVLDLAREAAAAWGRVLATLKHRPAPMTVFDAFAHLAPIVSLRGLPVARDYYLLLLDELEERVRSGIGGLKVERKRLMWDNIAVWFKWRDWARLFAQRGYSLVAATYTNAWAETIDNLDPGRPFESLARAYSLIILNHNLKHRLDLMARMARDFEVDGLIVHSAKSCKPYSVGQYDLKRLLRDRLDLPSVVVEADITDSRVFSEEQARARLEAFFETLEGRGADRNGETP